MRTTAILITIFAAILCAGCTAWSQVQAKRNLRQFEREWGVPNCINQNEL